LAEQKIRVLLPDVNSSGYAFEPVDEATIAYGLGAIKARVKLPSPASSRHASRARSKICLIFVGRVDKRIVIGAPWKR